MDNHIIIIFFGVIIASLLSSAILYVTRTDKEKHAFLFFLCSNLLLTTIGLAVSENTQGYDVIVVYLLIFGLSSLHLFINLIIALSRYMGVEIKS